MLNSTSTRFAFGAAVATAALATVAAFWAPARQNSPPRQLPPPPRRLPPPVVEPLPVVDAPAAPIPPKRRARAPRKSVNATPSVIGKRSPCFIITVACDVTDDGKTLCHRYTFKVRTAIEGEARQAANETARRFADRFATATKPKDVKSRTVSAGRVESCGVFRPRPLKRKAIAKGTSESQDRYNDRRACEYAKWLATRDGVAIDTKRYSGTAIWTGVTLLSSGNYQRRVRAVRFGSVEIAIPNWDFQPWPATEETLPDSLVELAA
jgi:hypothetical protein